MTKVNLEQQIKDKPVYIPKTKHVVTQRERSILERIVEAEATDKDEKSKILVANVILNRVRSKEFPNSIEAVVFQRVYGKVQFSPTADGRYESVHITKSTKKCCVGAHSVRPQVAKKVPRRGEYCSPLPVFLVRDFRKNTLLRQFVGANNVRP